MVRASNGVRTVVVLAMAMVSTAPAQAYTFSDAASSQTTIVLTGHELTIAQLVAIARHGAKVTLSSDAKQQEVDNYGLLLEAQAEGVPVYMLNRGGGLGRATSTLRGDPMSVDNKRTIETRELAAFGRGPNEGDGPEVQSEEIVRAIMAIRANGMVFETPSPQLSRLLLDFLNADITPVVQSRGSVGESDLYVLANIAGAMVGKGEVYYRGARVAAAEALRLAHMETLQPFGLDSSTLENSNGYSTALAALLVAEGKQALDWADLTLAIDLDGMNSSITPLTAPVQMKRPSTWLNWDAARILDLLKGGYLFNTDPQRILADPDSLRASSIRQGAAWEAWANLRDAVQMQMNSSDHNPVVTVGLSPQDSWELASPQMMQYYVKGGNYSQGKHGYIVSSANWDPYPMANAIEAFTNALVNAGVAVTQRTLRFDNPFFTVIKPSDFAEIPEASQFPRGSGTLTANLWQEMQSLTAPIPAAGIATDSQANGDIESQAVLKAERARTAVDVLYHLLGQDFVTGAYWVLLRQIQNPARSFGNAPTLAVNAARKTLFTPEQQTEPAAMRAYEFLRVTPAYSFYPPALHEPDGAVSIPNAR